MKLLIFVARLDFRISGPQRRSTAPPARLLRARGASGVISISAESPFPGNVDLEKVFLPPPSSSHESGKGRFQEVDPLPLTPGATVCCSPSPLSLRLRPHRALLRFSRRPPPC